ncbi:MAG: hypothetical protein ACO1RA_09430 [Planctomycetaceae bacterium]
MYFLLWLLIVIYFGLLAACNVYFAARMPWAISRWLAIGVTSSLLLAIMLNIGCYVFAYEYGGNPFLSHFDYAYNDSRPVLKGHFLPYLALATAILGIHFALVFWGLRNIDDQLRAARWPFIGLLVASFVCLFGAGMVFRIIDGLAVSDLLKKDADAKRQLIDLLGPNLSDSENAWIAYQAVTSLPSSSEIPEVNWDGAESGKGIPDSDPAVAEFAKQIREIVLQLRSASAVPLCQIHDREQPLGSLSSNGLGMQSLDGAVETWRDVLQFDAHFQASRQCIGEALLDIQALLQLSKHLAQDRTVIALKNSHACERAAIQAIHFLLANHHLSSGDLEKLFQQLSYNRREILAETLQREDLDLRRDIVTYYLPPNQNKSWDSTTLQMNLGRAFFASFEFQALDQTRPFRTTRPDESFASLLDTDKSRYRSWYELQAGHLDNIPSCHGNAIFGLIDDVVHMECKCRQTQVAISASLFALKEKHFPDSLEELQAFAPSLNAVDPVSGKPFQLIPDGSRLIICEGLGRSVSAEKISLGNCP